MLIAKNRQAHYLLSKDMKQVKRVYHCLGEGILEDEGIIDKPIIKDKNSDKMNQAVFKNGAVQTLSLIHI